MHFYSSVASHVAATSGLLLLLCASSTHAAPTGLLNDTGLTECFNGSIMETCSTSNTDNSAGFPRQDGRFGRDALTSLVKIGAGAAGFDFSKLCHSGELAGIGACPLNPPANTGVNPSANQWACTKDNVTRLIWSLNIRTGTSWNDASQATFPDAGHNTITRCGLSTGWRLPTRSELLTIVHLGTTNGYAIDRDYFPAITDDWYWSSDSYLPDPSRAWFVSYRSGFAGSETKSNPDHVILVRSEP